MKGLLIKDLRLMKAQKRFFLVLILMALMLSLASENGSFAVGYLTFVMPMFALSTISYDEFDNGNAFLFTLPISRRGYVAEKYVFSLLLGLISQLISTALALAAGSMRSMDAALASLMGAPFVFLAMVLMLAIMIPLQLKFGAEKSRIAIISIGGGAFLIGMGIGKLMEMRGMEPAALLAGLNRLNPGVVFAASAAAVAVVLAVSFFISAGIMQKKEF